MMIENKIKKATLLFILLSTFGCKEIQKAEEMVTDIQELSTIFEKECESKKVLINSKVFDGKFEYIHVGFIDKRPENCDEEYIERYVRDYLIENFGYGNVEILQEIVLTKN